MSLVMNVYWCKDKDPNDIRKVSSMLNGCIMPGGWKPANMTQMEQSIISFCKAVENAKPYSFKHIGDDHLMDDIYVSKWVFNQPPTPPVYMVLYVKALKNQNNYDFKVLKFNFYNSKEDIEKDFPQEKKYFESLE